MDGGKKKLRKTSASTSNSDDCDGGMSSKETNEDLELRPWSDTPIELMEDIVSKLNLEDNVRVSAVCKSWYRAALSVRVTGQSCWIMYFPKSGDTYDFFDPSQRKKYYLYLPELYDTRVLCSKDGWLLLYSKRTARLFFFNPFTREKVRLPRYEVRQQPVAFSCAPTSPGCVVFTLERENPEQISITTCHLGDKNWVTVIHPNRVSYVSTMWDKIVFCNGRFYCLSITGWIGFYDPREQLWCVLTVPPPRTPSDYLDSDWWKGKFMTVHNGEIIVIYTCSREGPGVFKLSQPGTRWEEMSSLHGMTVFAGFSASITVVDLLGEMRNTVYFSKVRFYGKRCISFSLDKGRYYPAKLLDDWGQQMDPFEAVWIEPPPNALSLMDER